MKRSFLLSGFLAKRLSAVKERNFSALIVRVGVVATAISVAIMIVASSLISGFQKTISEKIFGFWGHIHIIHNSEVNSYESKPILAQQVFYPKIKNNEPIKYIGPKKVLGFEYQNWQTERLTNGKIRNIQAFAFKAGIMKTKNEIEGIVLKGIDKNFDWKFIKDFIVKGRPIKIGNNNNREILISEQTAERLKLDVGKSLIIYFVSDGEQIKKKFLVSGIYKTGLEEYDRKFALIDMSVIQDLMGWTPNQVGGFEVFLEDVKDLDVYNAYIYETMVPDTLYTESIRQKLPNIFEWLELQNTNEQLIIGLMMMVAIINLSTALLILIVDRTNMIGILKALGASNFTIQKVFIRFSSYILLRGLFFGNLFGFLLAGLQKYFKIIKLSEKDYYLGYAPIHFDLSKIMFINIFTFIFVIIIMLIPSLMVRSITPIKAIIMK